MKKQLDSRNANGIEVALLWDPASDRVSVRVLDGGKDEELEFEVDPERALDAFHHPFAYGARSMTPC